MIRPSASSSTAAATTAIQLTFLRRSLLHTGRPLLLATPTNTASPASPTGETTAAAAGGRARKKKLNRVQAWLQSDGKPFQQVHLGGSNYVSRRGDQPFPMNPLFRPVPPLPDRVREDVFAQSQAGKPVGELAAQFRVSEARIRAILKLKQHERQLVAQGGFQLQHNFREGMERMLGALSRRSGSGGLDVAYVKPIRADPPYLLALDEDKVFEKEDALRMLKAGSAHGTDSAEEQAAFKIKNKKREAVKVVKETKRGKVVFNVNADVVQGHVKRVYKTELKTY